MLGNKKKNSQLFSYPPFDTDTDKTVLKVNHAQLLDFTRLAINYSKL